MSRHPYREIFLATCLLDALKDENYSQLKELLIDRQTNPNIVIPEYNIAPIHYAAGMENEDFSKASMKLILKCNGDPNVQTVDGETPMHIAVIWNRVLIVEMLLDHGANLKLEDGHGNTPINYAINENHYHLVTIFKKAIYEQKKLNKPTNRPANIARTKDNPAGDIALITSKLDLLRIPAAVDAVLTPNKTNYNYQSASPYYVNVRCNRRDETARQQQSKKADEVAARRKKFSRTISADNMIEEVIVISSDSDEAPEPAMVRTNLFELTEENLGRHLTLCPKESSVSLINVWRDKLQKTRQRESMLPKDSTQLQSFISANLVDSGSSNGAQTVVAAVAPQPADVPASMDDSYVTAPDDGNDDAANDGSDEMILAQEKYEHVDAENNMVIYETRTIARQSLISGQNSSFDSGTQTAESALPTDYDTDHLRDELRHFGDRPGPITKSTKRLYLKRLVRYKKRPQLVEANARKNKIMRKYSVQLQKTMQDGCSPADIANKHSHLEREMVVSFAQNASKKCREGNLKMSFIYLLIDPRVSENLPAESQLSTKQDIWRKFISSIFYVGKGKSSRPYAHLYDAIKLYDDNRRDVTIKQQESLKLDRIIDIWRAAKGVICLPLYHNITPSEAYTREAAIIDCLGVENLTNIKRGDYYGVTKSWPMNNRRKLGVYLLHKALHIFLAEGESQLRPDDLKK